MICRFKEKIKTLEWRTEIFPKFILLCLAISIFVFWSMLDSVQNKRGVKRIKPNTFENIKLDAKAAFVWDVNKKESLFGKNENMPLPLASLTKVMTAVTAKNIAKDMTEISIKSDDLAPEGDSNLKVASKWNFDNLIDYILVVSSNDGAKALAGAAGSWNLSQNNFSKDGYKHFIQKMNLSARQIGLANSIFFNEHGLDRKNENNNSQSTLAGAYGSAKDMAKLFEYAMINQSGLLEATRYPEINTEDSDHKIYSAINTNSVMGSIPSVIASKTGYTDLAGGNLVVAFDVGIGQPIIISVLGSTQEGRFNDMLQLVEASRKFIKQE